MHKHLARLEARDLIGWHAAVGAANPQILGRLLLRQMVKEARLFTLHAFGPGAVVVKEVGKVMCAHVDIVSSARF
jgi:hypothetical protein